MKHSDIKQLPIGIQSFPEIINNGYLYVDKTQAIHELVKNPKGYCFLSRPRRFGKSLLVSTLEEIFSANTDLFKGLWIEQSGYNWQKHPVMRIDFSKIQSDTVTSFVEGLKNKLIEIGQDYEIGLDDHNSLAGKAGALISELHRKTGQRVVILIDEYDAPIICNINYPEVLNGCREQLASFYRVIKGSDEHLRFVFLTGVSKFAKVSVFSGMNNLRDLSMSNDYSSMLGYTQVELESYFNEDIDSLASDFNFDREALLAEIKRWYNGYRFSSKGERVYNPFSSMLFFTERKFQNYWFETGTPTFLLELIRKNNYNIRNIQGELLSSRDFNSYDVERIPLLPILYNTGYLTISEVEEPRPLHIDYRLDYPNEEVRISFLEQFVDDAFSKGTNARSYVRRLTDSIQSQTIAQFIEVLKTFIAELPYDLQSLNRNTESYYQSLIYCLLKLVGCETYVEERTNRGRIDLVLEVSDVVYFFEMKVDKPAAVAVEQIKKRGYAEKYRLEDKKLLLIGLTFSSTERNISDYVIEEVAAIRPQL